MLTNNQNKMELENSGNVERHTGAYYSPHTSAPCGDKAGQKPFPALRYHMEQEPMAPQKPTTLPTREGEVML